MLSSDSDADAVCRHFDVSRESCARLHCYVSELKKWQRRINLVGPGTLDRVWTRHVADGLQVVPHLPRDADCLVDFGSGSGVPGLVVAAVVNSGRVVLVESSSKKAAFLRHVARTCGIRAEVTQARVEALDPATVCTGAKRIVLLARALAPLTRLLALAAPWFAMGAEALWHKGQDFDKELKEATRYWDLDVDILPSEIEGGGVLLHVRSAKRRAQMQA